MLWRRWRIIGLVGLVVLTLAGALGAAGLPPAARDAAESRSPYRPEVPILKVAHEGDAVPGVLGATFTAFAPPQIDAAGNVLVMASMEGPGIDSSNDVAVWFGQPGAIAAVAREGDPAPDMPAGVVYACVGAYAAVSETGWIALTAYVSGPGITEGENDGVIYCGPPGDLRKVIQTGDPAPGFWEGVVACPSDWGTFGASMTDNGTITVGMGVCGPDLPAEGTRAHWLGSREKLELLVWEGMPVPGCPECDPGVALDWLDTVSANDAGQMAFCGGLSGPGIYPTNDTGRWLGSASGWEMLHREGQSMPEFGDLVTVKRPTGGQYVLNKYGDKVNRIQLQGPGITLDNDWLLVAGQPEPMEVVVREGDFAPEAGEDVIVTYIGNAFVNNGRRILYGLLFDGLSVDESNQYGIYYGSYDKPRLIVRGGDTADYFPVGTTLYQATELEGSRAMNDGADFVGVCQVISASREPIDVLWIWRGLTEQFVPLVEVGAEVDGRTATNDQYGYFGEYNKGTGGSDGQAQSFNDRRELAVQLDFTDGTRGVYRVGPPLLGDTDGDGDVTVSELTAFADCATGPGGETRAECAALDLDLDADIDLADFRALQVFVGEPR